MNLAPELQDMLARVAQLQNRVHSGELSPDQAQVALDSIVSFDASGQRWQIAMRAGEPVFLASQPDQPPRPADPSSFQRPQPQVPPSFGGPDDLLTPPRPPQPSTDAQVLGSIFDGVAPTQPHSQFPVNQPTQPTQPFAPAAPEPRANGADFGAPTRPGKASALSRIPAFFKGAAASVGERLGPHKRLVVIGVVCAVALVAVISLQGRSSPAPEQSADCPPLPFAMSGLGTDERFELAACLNTIPATAPSVLQVVLTPTNQLVANAKVNRQGMLFAVGSLQAFASPAPLTPVTADLSQVAPDLQSGVQTAVNAKLVASDAIRPTEDVTRGQAATFIARLLRATRSDLPAPATLAPDAPNPDVANDQALLAALGISDTPPGAPYGFTNPFTAFAYIDMLGRTYEFLQQSSGSVASSVDLPPQSAVDAAAASLNSGSSDAILALLTTESTPGASLAVAQFVGLPATGLKAVASQPRGGESGPVSTVSIQRADGSAVGSGELRWVATEGGWKLDGLPALTSS